jgi:hypothetical protein
MALPKVATPTYELTIPSTGQKIKYRPFLVKEEKVLMMAAEQGGAHITKAIKDVLNACSESKINLKTLAPFDIEYFFLQLRGKSVGDKISIRLKKPDSIECEEENCEQLCTVDLNVADIEVDTSKVSDGRINITKDIGIKLKYPELDNMQKFITSGTDPTADEIFKLITESIEYIWEGEEIYKSRDTTKTELNDFIESLNSEQFGRIRSFFEDMPRLSKEVPWTCTKCGKSTTVTLQGIDSFFG